MFAGTFGGIFGAAAMDDVGICDLVVVWDHSSLVGGVCEKTLQCNSLPDQDNDRARENLAG